MNAKIDNLKELEYLGNIQLLSTLVLEAQQKKDSEKLKEMASAIIGITFYVNNLQMDRKCYNKAMSEFRLDKNRAVLRARKADEENEQQKKEIEKLKKLLNLVG